MLLNNVYPNPYPGIITNIGNPEIKKVEKKIPSVIHFKADYSGCSFYRLTLPEIILNYSNKANIQSLTRAVTDERMFIGVDVVRIQRQTTEAQLKYIEWLKSIQSKYGFRLIYEIDDVPFIEDIPLYNAARKEYINPQIQNSIKTIMKLCDEITVTTPFMKQLFKERLNYDRITIIPNFPSRMWMGNMYNQNKINIDYDNNKNKPRILYCGSMAHYDVANTGAMDDVSHIIDAIINHINDYQWIFLGGIPKKLKSWVDAKKIEYHPWVSLPNYPQKIYNLNIQAFIAPLANNNFNKAKSDLKLYEASCYGLPCFCQDLITYKHAKYKFTTGDELINLLNEEIKRAGHYKNLGNKIYKQTQTRWLENDENIALYEELYKYPYGDPRRILLNKYN